jgi:hypothetical protein
MSAENRRWQFYWAAINVAELPAPRKVNKHGPLHHSAATIANTTAQKGNGSGQSLQGSSQTGEIGDPCAVVALFQPSPPTIRF